MNLAWLLFLAIIACGIAFGYLRGGRLSQLGVPRSFVALLLVALSVQATVERFARFDSSLALAFWYVLAVACLVAMWRTMRHLRAVAIGRFALVALLL
jgi:hypothetical protein